jgi:thiamine-monophosphate kinase
VTSLDSSTACSTRWRSRRAQASSRPARSAEAILDELDVIDRYFRPLVGEGGFGLRDDAAALQIPAEADVVVTTDMIAERIHFLPDDPPDTIARKALRVNLSDLAAKGATPLAYTLSLGLHAGADDRWLAAFARGLGEDQAHYGISLIGGDTISVHGGAVVSITAMGLIAKGRMVHRFGGRAGDILYVSDSIGGGAAGLALLSGCAGPWNELPEQSRARLVARYRTPSPRLALAPALVDFATAAMDVSDGLIGDCDKLAAASGCSARLDAERVPIDRELAAAASPDLMATLLTGGDDYEILAAIPPQKSAEFERAAAVSNVRVTSIGILTEGQGLSKVMWEGHPLPLKRRAFVHPLGGSDKA